MITSWNTLPIREYKDLMQIFRSQITEEEKVFKATAILAGMDYERFLELPLKDSKELIAQAGFLYTQPKAAKVKSIYHLGSRDYKLMKNVNGMTTAQYINYQAIVHIPPIECIDSLMAIILVPDGHKYGEIDEDIVTDEIASNLDIESAMGIADFFTTSYERSIRNKVSKARTMIQFLKWMGRPKDKEERKAWNLQMETLLKELDSTYGYLSLKQ